MVNCTYCQTPYEPPLRVGRKGPLFRFFCTPYCKERFYKAKVTFNCERCGKETTQLKKYYKRWDRHFCNKKCSDLSRISPNLKPRAEVKCAQCGTVKMVKPSDLKVKKTFFCNQKCKSLWQIANIRNEANPNWKGGFSFEPYPRGWKKALKERIRERDGRKCRLCLVSEAELGYKLHCHHIDYDKKNLSDSNLISLCRKCHLPTNTGRLRKAWTAFFRKLMGQSELQGNLQSPAEMPGSTQTVVCVSNKLDFIALSELEELVVSHPIVEESVYLLGLQAAEVVHREIQTVLNAGTNVS